MIKRALEQAQLSASAVNYIEAHGTGTPLGDPIEMGALVSVIDFISSMHKLEFRKGRSKGTVHLMSV